MRKFRFLAIVAAITATVTVGCNKTNSGGTADSGQAGSGLSSTAEITSEMQADEQLEPVTLKIILPGDRPADMNMVIAEAEKRMEGTLNVKLDVVFYPFSDMKQKMETALAAGEEIDCIALMLPVRSREEASFLVILSVNVLRNRLLLSITILMAIPVIMLFVKHSQTLKPFDRLAKDVKEQYPEINNDSLASAEPEKRVEYQVIQRCITYLGDNLDTLQASLNSYRELLYEEQIRRWLVNGRLFEDVDSLLRRRWGDTEYVKCILCVIRIDKGLSFQLNNSYTVRKDLKSETLKLAEDLLEPHGYAAIGVDMGSDHMVLLLKYVHGSFGMLNAVLEEVEQYVKKCLALDITVARSRPVQIIIDISQLYKEIYELTRIKFLTGENKVYTEEDSFLLF